MNISKVWFYAVDLRELRRATVKIIVPKMEKQAKTTPLDELYGAKFQTREY